jgi:hypothetical protein
MYAKYSPNITGSRIWDTWEEQTEIRKLNRKMDAYIKPRPGPLTIVFIVMCSLGIFCNSLDPGKQSGTVDRIKSIMENRLQVDHNATNKRLSEHTPTYKKHLSIKTHNYSFVLLAGVSLSLYPLKSQFSF